MKKGRFTEEQIIGILREQELGAATGDLCRKQRRDVLHLESQVRRARSVGGQAAAVFGRRRHLGQTTDRRF